MSRMPPGFVVGQRAAGRPLDRELLELGPDPPVGRRFPATMEVGRQIGGYEGF
jgi:hypothetical protein